MGDWLAFGDQIEEIEEFREADVDGFRALDEGFAFGAESGYGEGHGDAVVAAGINCGAVKSLASGNIEAVFKLGDFGAHGAEVFDDEGDAVGLLDAEFLGVADAN